MDREIIPLRNFQADVTVPGSKSFTQRALVIASLAKGESVIHHPLFSEDTHLLIEALSTMGVKLRKEGEKITVQGLESGPYTPARPLHLGNNGTGLRLLCAFCALGNGRFIMTGDSRLRERPISPLISALEELGDRKSVV